MVVPGTSGVVIKGVDKDRWVTIGKIAVPLKVSTAMTSEVMGVCVFTEFFDLVFNKLFVKGISSVRAKCETCNVAEKGEPKGRCREHPTSGLTWSVIIVFSFPEKEDGIAHACSSGLLQVLCNFVLGDCGCINLV